MLEFTSINNDCNCSSENLQQFSDPACPTSSIVTWNSIQGKPSCFIPCAHTHVPTDIIGLAAYIETTIFASSIASTNSIQLTAPSGVLNANLKISSNAGTGYKVPLSILSDGLIGQIPYATGSVAGILSFSDWNTFNSKFNTPAGTTSQYVRGDGSLATFPSIVATTRQINTSSPLTGGGDLSADRTISIPAATTSVNGYLSSTDWNIFNSKLSNVLTDSLIWVGNASNIPTQVSLSLSASGGTFGLANTGILTFPNSSSTTRGLLTSADWVIFNNKMGGSGTSGTIPIFTGANAIGDSLITYVVAGLTSTVEYASGNSNGIFKATGTVSGEVEARGASNFTKLTADSTASSVVYTSSKELRFIEGSTTRGFFNTNGTLCLNYGIAIDGITYYNTVAGTATSIANNSYGVVIGSSTGATITVTLPSSPVNGQECAIMVEANRTINLSSSKTIYGHNNGTGIAINLTNGASALILKYSTLGNSNVGAWYITGVS